jgi:hypothetical protein
MKTVELIVERTDWEPPPEKLSDDLMVALRIEGYQIELRKRVKTAGGKWNPERRVWYVRYGEIAGTELEKHIYVDTSG